MGSEEDVVAREALLLELSESALNIVINQDWFWDIEKELRDTYPSFVAAILGSILHLLGDGLISLRFTLHTMDPDDSNWGTFSIGWRLKNNLLS